MKEEIEVKRKVYSVVEQIGEHSYKVERKGQFFFLKKFENDSEKFDAFCDAEHRLRVSGVTNPKCYIYDKKARIAVVDYIEGKNCLDMLIKEDLSEDVLDLLFKTFWYARTDRFGLNYSPENFKYSNGKLFYLPFIVGEYEGKEAFLQKDIRLWFFTKEFIRHCYDLGIKVDEKRLKSDYELNKTITLAAVKFYR